MRPLEVKARSIGVERTPPPPTSLSPDSVEGREEMRAVSEFQFTGDIRVLRGGETAGEVKKLTSVTGNLGREKEGKPCVASLRQSGKSFQKEE